MTYAAKARSAVVAPSDPEVPSPLSPADSRSCEKAGEVVGAALAFGVIAIAIGGPWFGFVVGFEIVMVSIIIRLLVPPGTFTDPSGSPIPRHSYDDGSCDMAP